MQNAANTTQSGWHWGLFLTSVFLPFAVVLLMNGIEGSVDSMKEPTWPQRLMKIAWDSCVLAIGLIGGVFSNPEVIKRLMAQGAIIVAISSVIIAFGTAFRIGSWRKELNPKGWQVLISLALSGGVLAIPATVALSYESLSRLAALFN
jgi:hypothetical protein